MRIIMIISANIISGYGSFFEARGCVDIDYMFSHSQNRTELFYPECAAWYSGANPNQYAVIQADMRGNPAQIAVALGLSFSMAMWVSLAIHAIGVEVYVSW